MIQSVYRCIIYFSFGS